MRDTGLRNNAAYFVILLLSLQACKDDSNLLTPLPQPDKSFTESFDNYQEAYDKGWRSINASQPIGRKWYDLAETPDLGSPNYLVTYFPGWDQAQLSLDRNQFPNAPYPNRIWENAFLSQRASNGYVATSIACAAVINFGAPSVPFDVNTWLISPETLIKNGDKIAFYTYCKNLARLQLWINPTNSFNTGTGINNTGDFNINLVDINPEYATEATDPAAAFPVEWTRFEGEVKGLFKPVMGRFGFRYLLQNRPPIRPSAIDINDLDTLYTQIHRTVIGIDEVTFKSAE